MRTILAKNYVNNHNIKTSLPKRHTSHRFYNLTHFLENCTAQGTIDYSILRSRKEGVSCSSHPLVSPTPMNSDQGNLPTQIGPPFHTRAARTSEFSVRWMQACFLGLHGLFPLPIFLRRDYDTAACGV